MRIEFDHAGHVVAVVENDWREPVCPECGKPIAWILDMHSWVNVPQGFALVHGGCAWADLPNRGGREDAA